MLTRRPLVCFPTVASIRVALGLTLEMPFPVTGVPGFSTGPPPMHTVFTWTWVTADCPFDAFFDVLEERAMATPVDVATDSTLPTPLYVATPPGSELGPWGTAWQTVVVVVV